MVVYQIGVILGSIYIVSLHLYRINPFKAGIVFRRQNLPPTSMTITNIIQGSAFTILRPENEMNRALGHLCAHIG